jgi:glycosyltransferase involved in cell wall biosynthesis
MKACMVAYTFYEEDNRVRRYAEALAKRGDHVDVVALRKPGQPSKETLNGVNVYRIQRRVVNEKGAPTYLGRLLLFFLRSMLFLTYRQFGKDRYDLVHVHSVPDFEVFAAIVPKLMGCKIILDIHDLVPEFYCTKFKTSKDTFTFKILVAIERMAAGFSDHVIAANHIWQKRLEERSVKHLKCTTILNYPDTDIFRRLGKNRPDGKFIILYPGTLNAHQGLDVAVRAFSLIEKQAPEAELHIYGEGDQRNNLKSLVTDLGLSGKVFLNDPVPLDKITAVIENADLGVVPKRKDGFGNEAFSTKTLEFMSLGIPLLISDTMVDRYYFNDTVVKFFCASDERSLADAMLLLIKHPEICQTLANNASDFVKRYTWDANKDVYFGLVDSLVHSVNGARAA